ncbi:MAG: nucleotidyltransferase domain-containing protein [Chloroflexi bacterium]|nr:MAG: nucleotidyltransferase domain-containing protein [Chloroflexota bacterium]
MNRKEALAKICKQYFIQTLYVFGSRSKSIQAWILEGLPLSANNSSDVDVGIKPNKTLSIRDKVMLAQQLEDFFGVSHVDVVLLTEADPFLAANIIRGERLYTEDTYLADEYDLYILRRAADLIPLELERQQLILDRHT